MMRKLLLLFVAAITIAAIAIVTTQLNAPPPVLANEFLEFRLASDDPQEGFTEHEVDPELVSTPEQATLFIEDEVRLTGKDIANVAKTVDDQGQPALSIDMTASGAQKMQLASTAAIDETAGRNKRLAVMFDGHVMLAPVVRSRMGGRLLLSGNFDEAKRDGIYEVFTGTHLPLATWGMPYRVLISGDQRHELFDNGRQVLVNADKSFHLLTEQEAVLSTDNGFEIVDASDPRLSEPTPFDTTEHEPTDEQPERKPSVLAPLRPKELPPL